MNLRRLPWWRLAFLVMTFVGLIGFEVTGLIDTGPDDTWSEIVWYLAERSILFVLACGITLGHFFWQRKRS